MRARGVPVLVIAVVVAIAAVAWRASTTSQPAGSVESPGAREPLDATNAVLEAPAVGDDDIRSSDDGCDAMTQGGRIEACVPWSVGGVDHRVTVEAEADGALSATVVRHLGGDRWQVTLVARGEPGLWDSVGIQIADVDDDGVDEAVVGYRLAGAGSIIAIDVVEGPGAVRAHLTADGASVVVAPGRIDVWTAAFGPDDATCCPSSALRSRVVAVDGDLVLEEVGVVDLDEVPESQL